MILQIKTTGEVSKYEIPIVESINATQATFKGSSIQITEEGVLAGIDNPYVVFETIHHPSPVKKSYQETVDTDGEIQLDASLAQNFFGELTTSSTGFSIINPPGSQYDCTVVFDAKIGEAGIDIPFTGFYTQDGIKPVVSQNVGVYDTYCWIKNYEGDGYYLIYKRGYAPQTVTISGFKSTKSDSGPSLLTTTTPKLPKKFTLRGEEPALRAIKKTFYDESDFVANGVVYGDREENGDIIQKNLSLTSSQPGKFDGIFSSDNVRFVYAYTARTFVSIVGGVATLDCNKGVHLLLHDQDITLLGIHESVR